MKEIPILTAPEIDLIAQRIHAAVTTFRDPPDSTPGELVDLSDLDRPVILTRHATLRVGYVTQWLSDREAEWMRAQVVAHLGRVAFPGPNLREDIDRIPIDLDEDLPYPAAGEIYAISSPLPMPVRAKVSGEFVQILVRKLQIVILKKAEAA